MNVDPEPPLIIEKRNSILQGAQKLALPGQQTTSPKINIVERFEASRSATAKKSRTPKQAEALRKAREARRERLLMKRNGVIEKSEIFDLPERPQVTADPIVEYNNLMRLLADENILKSEILNTFGEAGSIAYGEEPYDDNVIEVSLVNIFGDIPKIFQGPVQMTQHPKDSWKDGESPFRFKNDSILRLRNELGEVSNEVYTLGTSTFAEEGKLESHQNESATWAYLKQRQNVQSSSPGFPVESFHNTAGAGLRPGILSKNGLAQNTILKTSSTRNFIS